MGYSKDVLTTAPTLEHKNPQLSNYIRVEVFIRCPTCSELNL